MDKDMRKMFKEAVRKSRQVSHPEDIMIQYELGPLTIPDWAYEPDPDTGEIDPNPAQWGTYDQGKFSGFTTKEEVPVGLRPIVQGNKLILPNDVYDEGQDHTNNKPNDTIFSNIMSKGGIIANDYITIERTDNGYLIYTNTPHPMSNRIGRNVFRVSLDNNSKLTVLKPIRSRTGRIIRPKEKININHVNHFKSQLRRAIKNLADFLETGSEKRTWFTQSNITYSTESEGELVEHRLSVRVGKTGYKDDHGDYYVGIDAEAVINDKDYEQVEDEYDMYINFFTCRAVCHYAYMDVLADFFELDLPPTFRKKINAKPKPRAPSMTMASGETIPIHTKPAIQDKTLLDAEAFIKSMKR